MNVYIPLPRLSAGLASNLLGLAGIAGLLVAVVALTDWRWSLLLGSLILIAVSWVASTRATEGQAARPVSVTVSPPAGMNQAQVQQTVNRALREAGKTLRPA